MRHLLFIAALLAPSLAGAAEPLSAYSKYGRVLNAALLSASSNSFAIDNQVADRVGVWDLMDVWVCATDADNGVSLLTMSCTGSHDNGTTDYTLQDCTTASGVATCVDLTWTKNPGANTTCWPYRVSIHAIPEIECTFTDTGGDASDSITVYVSFATE